jgi:hypothetical protein
MEETAFELYLKKKKINPELFKAAEPQRYEEFRYLFEQLHEDSFTMQKLYLLNQLRRKYLRKDNLKE